MEAISEGHGFEVPNNIHFRFEKRRNTSNFFCLTLSSLSLTTEMFHMNNHQPKNIAKQQKHRDFLVFLNFISVTEPLVL